ncbi:unnamed protein product [Urochloa humidicola]
MCFVRCKSIPADKDAFLLFPADVRSRLDPPADGEYFYFGTCLSGCLATVPARELHHGEGRALAAAAEALEGAIRGMAEDPVAGWDLVKMSSPLPRDRCFRAYEVADFGWGRPARTVPATMNRDGQVAMVRARDGNGVQLSVSLLQRAHMDAFKAEFLQLLE